MSEISGIFQIIEFVEIPLIAPSWLVLNQKNSTAKNPLFQGDTAEPIPGNREWLLAEAFASPLPHGQGGGRPQSYCCRLIRPAVALSEPGDFSTLSCVGRCSTFPPLIDKRPGHDGNLRTLVSRSCRRTPLGPVFVRYPGSSALATALAKNRNWPPEGISGGALTALPKRGKLAQFSKFK